VESRYWHAANAASLALGAAVDERDALAARVEGAERALAALRRTNVLADVFPIRSAGAFGTICGLRLGRTPEEAVEWDEINAAWGQAVLMLDCLARKLGAELGPPHRLEPRGSYPRVHDGRGAAELFGPANKILCPSYDRAQAGFLACLQELARALAARGATVPDPAAAAAAAARKPFELPYPVDGDRVGGLSVRYALSRDKAWTRALKRVLANLKVCLWGVTEVAGRRGEAAVAALPREGPAG
jgi:beclin 1